MSEYLRYVIQNIEPLRIADDSKSQSGQTTTLRYIPGTTIRGYVVNELAKTAEFEQIKKALFSKNVRFLNAYINENDRELMPSPKGFYEDKTIAEGRKKLENVVIKGEFPEGYKRASLGQYCYLEEDCIHYYSVNTGSDMKIKSNIGAGEKQNVFRNEYVTKGHTFTGYIAIDDSRLKETIKQVFGKEIITLGNARSAGFGKCNILACDETDSLPYEKYLPEQDLEGSCYMMLLSNTTMRNQNGEICGMDWSALSKKLNVEIEEEKVICSTSTVNVKGYNRMWKNKIPSTVMYEQGSVFHLTFKGKLTREVMYKLCNEGIGIRLNEGFGRILFIRDYEKITYKLTGERISTVNETAKLTDEDRKTLKTIAKAYYYNQLNRAMNHYVVGHGLPRGSSSNSKLGTIESFAIAYRYNPEQGIKVIQDYFKHALDKEEKNNTQKERSSIKSIKSFVEKIIKTDIEELLEMKEKDNIMGISKQELLSKSEEDKLKLTLIVSMIQYDNKEGK